MRKLHYLMPVDVEEKIIVKYLVEQGADINKENQNRETSLLIACECRRENYRKIFS